MSLRENLKKYREQAGYSSAKKFAALVGVPYSSYMSYENKGSWPNEETLTKISQTLKVSVDALLGINVKKDSLDTTLDFDTARQIAAKSGIYVEKAPPDPFKGENHNPIKRVAISSKPLRVNYDLPEDDAFRITGAFIAIDMDSFLLLMKKIVDVANKDRDESIRQMVNMVFQKYTIRKI